VTELRRDDLLADRDLRGAEFCRAYAGRIDDWLVGLFERSGAPAAGTALVAVGGYGRGEMCPHSDVDLLLLHADGVVAGPIAERIWYPVWDAGIKLGHATFTVKQALRLGETELDVATAHLSCRHLAGDPTLSTALLDAARGRWIGDAGRWLPRLRELSATRTIDPGEVAFVLEPDLKLGRGGLRDANVLGWLELLDPELLERDRAVYDAAVRVLLDARVALHRRFTRPSDVLLLQEQDGVAADLGYPDADDLMAAVAGAARAVEWLTDDAFDRLDRGGRRWRRNRTRRLGNGVVLRGGQIQLDEPVAAEDTAAAVQLLDIALAAAHSGLRIGRATLETFAAAGRTFPEPWPSEIKDRFVELLRSGRPMIPVVETLDHWGLMVRIIPEWAPCRSRPQRNAYHRFTVDRHLCEAAANAAGLVARVDRPDLLVAGALLHDIGKGYPPRDHTEVGVEIVEDLAPRLGFDAADTVVLVDMVRHHLLLPDVATRRDLSDRGTIDGVARQVGSVPTLRLLQALTEADSMATGPAAWGEWKAALVRELADKTAHVLAGGSIEDAVSSQFPTVDHRRLMAESRRSVHGEGFTLTVVDHDRPGLFSKVAGVVALNGLDVLAAAAFSDEDGMALCEFRVEPSNPDADAIDWVRVADDVERALDGRLAVRARLAERARTYVRRRPLQARPWAPFDNKVIFDNETSANATVVEVRAHDAIGLLHRITSTMAELDLDIRSAKVQTLGDHVVDAFYVRDQSGGKIDDEEYLAEISRALGAVLRA